MKVSASTKLIGSVALLVGLSTLMGGSSLAVNYRLGQQLDLAMNAMARSQTVASQMSSEASEMEAAERGLALAMLLKQAGQAESMRSRFARSEQEIHRLMGEFVAARKAMASPADLGRVTVGYESARRHHAALVRLMGDQKMDDAIALLNTRILPELMGMSEEARRVVARQRGEMAALENSSQATRAGGFLAVAVLNVICLVVGVMAFLTVRRVNSSLRQMVAELTDGAEQLGGTSSEVSSHSLTLSKAASDQAASLEETSASTEQIHSMTRSNAANSKEASGKMQQATAKVDEANRALDQMVGSMHEISNSSSKISKIIKVIDEIAFQTNILALNAAVEAARAGEAGLGFAVVADEVRSLSQRSAQAAKDTTDLIEESIARSNEGKAKLDEVAQASHAVNDLVKTVTSLVEQVRLGSEEQERGTEQIAKSITRMERVTQQVAANAQEGANAGEELKQHASSVEGIVVKLQVLVGVGRPAKALPRQAPRLPAALPLVQKPLPVVRAAKPRPKFEHPFESKHDATAIAVRSDAFPMEGDFTEF